MIKILLNSDEGWTYVSVKDISKDKLVQSPDPATVVKEALVEVSQSVVEMWAGSRKTQEVWREALPPESRGGGS